MGSVPFPSRVARLIISAEDLDDLRFSSVSHRAAQAAVTAIGMAGMIYRLLWLALDEDPTLVPLQLDASKMPTALALCAEFQASRASN
jgi:hypothetical protein